MATSKEKKEFRQTTLDSLSKTHGSALFFVECEGGPVDFVAFKLPDDLTYARVQSIIAEDTKKIFKAHRALFDECVVFPGESEREGLADNFPALVDRVAGEVRTLSSLKATDDAKKHYPKS